MRYARAVSDKDTGRARGSTAGRRDEAPESGSLLDGLLRRAGRVAGGTLDLAIELAAAGAMFGDARLRELLATSASPERLEAMAEAGHFLRDARETAGLTLQELAERLELRDEAVLRGVEEGRAILPLELMLRAASLLARHDPIPFLIKFLRSYNPALEATLEQWGVMALPRNYERERRFVNLYRQHDYLRELSDDAYQRFIDYMDASTQLVVEMMQRERAARGDGASRRRSATAGAANTKGKPRATAKPRASAGSRAGAQTPAGRPVVRKVKPRTRGS